MQQCEVTGGHREVSERSSRSQHRSRATSRVSDYSDYSGPVIGQARALVSCVPSPYDTDVLAFQVRKETINETFKYFSCCTEAIQ